MKSEDKIERFVACSDGYDSEAFGRSLGYAKLITEKNLPGTADVVLLTHTKQQLHHTSLASMLGEQLTKALDKGAKAKLPFNATLRHATLKTIGFGGRNLIIISFYANERMMDVVDGLRGVAGVIVVPDLVKSADVWIKRWNPKIYGELQKEALSPVSDKVIVNALQSLTSISNISHDSMHTRDKEHADEILRILRAKGHVLAPAGIKSLLVLKGWRPKAADEIAKLAGRIADLKAKPSLAKFYDPHGRYERWKNGED